MILQELIVRAILNALILLQIAQDLVQTMLIFVRMEIPQPIAGIYILNMLEVGKAQLIVVGKDLRKLV